ncbi:uncharacterized protein RAG0_13149 [Rhynchosporium agropyri]|uniref:Uncharacterized protein n=1 Tax=Rhynchosporium agropyri TaxID=914238 RepID=A0A1E1LBB7_9HELO|nr:uncharacterized protein RAG0_13149 [Rhynchosporium agropyri]
MLPNVAFAPKLGIYLKLSFLREHISVLLWSRDMILAARPSSPVLLCRHDEGKEKGQSSPDD